MNGLAAQRREMRLAMRGRRAALDRDDQDSASMAVMARLVRLPLLRSARVVSGYRASRGEIDIDAALVLIGEADAVITVPRVVGEHLEFLPWHPGADTERGPFGIDEPLAGEPIPLRLHDVALVPLVAFDSRGNRLGQGGGYYDRALAASDADRPVVIGVAHSFQQVESIPTESWDVPLDAVVTEDTLTEFRRGALEPPSD